MQIVGDNRIIFSFLSDSVIAKMPELPRNYSFKTAHRIKTTSHNINQSHAATDSQEPGHQHYLHLHYHYLPQLNVEIIRCKDVKNVLKFNFL